ncbi:esterase family protein [Streptomycetaceae bacterium NBC_01309]
MKRTLARSATALVMAIGALATALVAMPTASAETPPTSPPALANGHGLTQIPTAPNPRIAQTPYDFSITVSTPEVAGTALNDGGHHIRIVLPSDYYSDPGKRYPVLYLLNGSSESSDAATYFNGYSKVDSSSGMIFVMPDGGSRGWYSNWLNQNSAAGAQRWENFHINQVIPFIDANLRTKADKPNRAVAGISMGGYGAVRYAERHPDLFSQVASFSGDLDLSRMSAQLRTAVVGSLLTFSPQVNSDDLYGTPYPFSLVYPYSDVFWNENSPGTKAANLQGIGVSFYVGNGGGGALPPPITDPNMFLEWWLPGANDHFRNALDAAGVPYYYVNYGNGAGTPWAACGGGHNWDCWNQDFIDYIPRLQQAFGITP